MKCTAQYLVQSKQIIADFIFSNSTCTRGASLLAQTVDEAPACNVGALGSIPGSGRSPGEGNGKPTPESLPGKSHGRRSLSDYSPRGHKELDMTERLTRTHPLQYSCLENPVDRGAWWAAI